MLEKRGRKIIGWDEILEGGLSENATVMSWRGTEGGIEAAMQKHDVIMTPGSDGMYLDWYQGDSKVEPVTIPSPPRYLASTYNYNPVPDTIKALGLAHHILGVQCNNWSEYMYSNAKMEYMMYPRAIALSEIAWSPVSRKTSRISAADWMQTVFVWTSAISVIISHCLSSLSVLVIRWSLLGILR